jgi:hypothetical protein
MSYAKAIRILSPSRAEMARRHAPYKAQMKAARDAVRAELASGADAESLYRAECAKRAAGDSGHDGDRAAVLLGVLRHGMAALD